MVALTAGVDVQDNRLEVEVLGHGRDGRVVVDNLTTIYGDPSGRAAWNDLDDLLAAWAWLGSELHIG